MRRVNTVICGEPAGRNHRALTGVIPVVTTMATTEGGNQMTPVRILIAMAAVAGSAGLLAGCGSSVPTDSPSAPASASTTPAASSTGTATPTASPMATSSPSLAGAAACATSALHVVVPSSGGGAAAGSTYFPIQFSNTSSSPCTLYGYPGVSFVGAVGGSQIGAAATRNPTLAATLVTLSPGQTVHATLQVVNAQNYPPGDCGLVTAHWLKVYPPNQTAPLYVSFTAQTCSKPKTILSVQTVQTGSSGT
jgi:hypothetical protein